MRVNPNAAQAANYTVLQRQSAAQNAYQVLKRAELASSRKAGAAQPVPTVAQFQPAQAPNAPAPTTPQTSAPGAIEAIRNAPLLTRTEAPAANADPALQTYGDLHLAAVKSAFGAKKGDERYSGTADANSDGVVDFNDTTHILSNWGKQVTGASDAPAVYDETFLAMVQQNMGAKVGDDRFSSASDANADGVVDFNDIVHVLSNWGQPVPGGGGQSA